MLDLFGNHIVGFPTRWLICYILEVLTYSSPLTLELCNEKTRFLHMQTKFADSCANTVNSEIFA